MSSSPEHAHAPSTEAAPPTAFTPDYPIVTERLLLRPHRMDDLGDLLRFHSDPDVVRYTPWPVRDRAATEATLRTKLDQASLTAEGQWLVLAIELRETSRVIGEVLLKWASQQHRQGELGFALARDQHGRGLAAEAAEAVLRMGFDDLGLHRISAVCIEENTDSATLLHRLGFALQGRFVDSVLFKGEWSTELVFGLDEDTWRKRDTRDQRTADVVELNGLIRCYFDAFTSGGDVDARMDRLRAVMLPEAIIVRTCGQIPAVYDTEAFIAPRRQLLIDGTLTDFSEAAQTGRLDVFGDIAQWFGRYTKTGLLDGAPYDGAGMKSIQFVRTDNGWRISAASWDDECNGLSAGDWHTSA